MLYTNETRNFPSKTGTLLSKKQNEFLHFHLASKAAAAAAAVLTRIIRVYLAVVSAKTIPILASIAILVYRVYFFQELY